MVLVFHDYRQSIQLLLCEIEFLSGLLGLRRRFAKPFDFFVIYLVFAVFYGAKTLKIKIGNHRFLGFLHRHETRIGAQGFGKGGNGFRGLFEHSKILLLYGPSCYNQPMLKIVKDTIPSLRTRCAEVPLPLSPENRALIDEMLKYLVLTQDPEFQKKHPNVREGVGLAAPQIGHNVRMLVISYPTEDENRPLVQYQLVNPKIVVNSVKKCYLSNGEGCLSVDNEHPGYVYRDFKIVVKAFDAMANQEVSITARGYEAIVLQHEIDHLNGVLFYDHIDKLDPYKKIPGAVAI